MSDGINYRVTELGELLEQETAERRVLEGEVIVLGTKIDACSTAVAALSSRLDRHVEVTHRKLDRLMTHLGVPPEGA